MSLINLLAPGLKSGKTRGKIELICCCFSGSTGGVLFLQQIPSQPRPYVQTNLAVAAFNIVSSLVLMVADKRSDIAVLRTMGVSARQIMAIFIVQGSAIGFFGTFIGTVIGCIVAVTLTPIISAFESFGDLTLFLHRDRNDL